MNPDREQPEPPRPSADELRNRAEDDERTERLAQHGAERFAELLRRLGD
jgi:hypothetical protein